MPSASDFNNCPILSGLAPEDLAHACPDGRLLRFSLRDIIFRFGGAAKGMAEELTRPEEPRRNDGPVGFGEDDVAADREGP